MQKHIPKAIIFIHKDKFEYYDEIQSKVFQFIFQISVFQDLELVDGVELNKQIKAFVTANKLVPATVLFIISNTIIFEKLFPITPTTNKTMEINNFLENIPFEHVSYKIFEDPKSCRILATNHEIYSSIQSPLEDLGFQGMEAVAQPLLGQSFYNTPALNLDLIKYIMSNFDVLNKQSFGYEENKNPDQQNSPINVKDPVNLAKPIDKFRLPALISVFVILIGVLGFVVYKQYTPASKASPIPPAIVVPTLIPQAPVNTEIPTSSPSANPT